MPGSYTVPGGKLWLPEQQQSEPGVFTLPNMENLTWQLLCVSSPWSQKEKQIQSSLSKPLLQITLQREGLSPQPAQEPSQAVLQI